MKQLSTALKNILPTAAQTISVPAVRKCSLTNADMKTITAEVEQLKVYLPQVQAEKALALLKLHGNLSKTPVFRKEMIHTEKHGVFFVPVDIQCEELDESQKMLARNIVQDLCKPISNIEFTALWAKLRLLSAFKEPHIDEKMAMRAYFEELKKYPASIVREVMNQAYKWFPSYYELKERCDNEMAYINLLKKKWLFNTRKEGV